MTLRHMRIFAEVYRTRNVTPVSYTHLDGYKRQEPSFLGCR